MGNRNNYMTNAKSEKKDEFYTQYHTIVNELQYYVDAFKDKVIYCNCDTIESKFVEYFINNYEKFGIKKFIATGYNENGHGSLYIIQYNGLFCDKLEGDGSFDSDECIKYLDESDIIITNPPFSRVKDFVKLLIKYNKQFIFIGRQNMITQRHMFELVMENKIWLSYNTSFPASIGYFINKHYENTSKSTNDELIRISDMCWWTNMKPTNNIIQQEHWKLNELYDEHNYIKFDNYDAINCDRSNLIPKDYTGVIAVPVTYYIKHDSSKYKILGMMGISGQYGAPLGIINGKNKYKRLLIKKL